MIPILTARSIRDIDHVTFCTIVWFLEVQAATLNYTPFSGFRGSDVIRYTVADNLGLRSAEQTITIDINEAPVAVNDRSGGFRDRSIDINVASNDSDPDGNA